MLIAFDENDENELETNSKLVREGGIGAICRVDTHVGMYSVIAYCVFEREKVPRWLLVENELDVDSGESL